MRDDEALFAEDLAPADDGTANFAYLLGAAVVLDSYFFKEDLKDKKWTGQDTEAFEFLMKYADVGHDYWEKLNTAKFDV